MSDRDIFHAALAITDSSERSAYLEQACAGAAGLKERIAGLVEMHEQVGSFLESPAAGLPSPIGGERLGVRGTATIDEPITERTGTVIGPYKLLEQIGEGGFGVVFMAEQTQPVRRKVALKVLKPGMDTRQVIARFEAERQALAIMDHPNIAKVHDGGMTGEPGSVSAGRPYFVMELVRGTPITEFCDQNHLAPRQRVELFASACEAVQHAHQKGIIHRDLKPSNVLVAMHDGTPQVKIIDFGVAKALGQQLTDKTLFTGFAQMIGTPLYMSPEQAGQSPDIDTRSDIYSLGVLLYELLTGSTPFTQKRFQQAAYDEIRRIIREEEPPKPSTRLSTTEELPSIAANRGLEPKKLSGLVRGELDWIVMKCLEKDRNRRYETANGIAHDIERYLHDQPVQACPPSATYRLKKWLRRHKGPVLAASVIVILLVGGILGTGLGFLRAKQREELSEAARRQTRAALNAMTDDVIEQVLGEKAHLGEHEKAFLRKIEGFYQELAHSQGGTAQARSDQADGLLRLGLIRLGLGEFKEAESDYRASLELCRKLTTEFPSLPKYWQELARVTSSLAELLRITGRLVDAEKLFQEALSILEDPAALSSKDPDQLFLLTNTQANFALLLQVFQRPGYRKEAEKVSSKAVSIYQELVHAFPTDPIYRDYLARGQHNLAFSYAQRGAVVDAISTYRQAIEGHDKLVKDNPNKPHYRDHLARHYTALAALLGRNARMKVEALETFQLAVQLQERLAADYPGVPDYRRELATTYNDLGADLADDKHFDKALESFRKALALREKLAAEYPDLPQDQANLSKLLGNVGWWLHEQGKSTEALEFFERAIARDKDAIRLSPRNGDFQFALGNHFRQLAEVLIRLGHHRLATEAAGEIPQAVPDDWLLDAYYYAIRLMSECVPLAENDPKLSPTERKTTADRYGAEAVRMLQQAIEKGFKSSKSLREDKAFAPLRKRTDFDRLLKVVEGKPE